MKQKDFDTIHSRLSEEMRKAWDLYHKDMEIPEPDFSFLEKKKPEKKHSFCKATLKVASVLLVIFVLSSAVGIWYNADNSYGVKSYVQNFKHFLSPEDQPTMDENGVIRMQINEWEDLDLSKNVIQKLFYPSYVPKGFNFNYMEIVRDVEFVSLVYEYTGRGKDDVLQVSIALFQNDGDTYLRGKEYTSPDSGKEFLIDYDKAFKIYCATYVNEGGYIFIADGASTREEAIQIVEGIRLKK